MKSFKILLSFLLLVTLSLVTTTSASAQFRDGTFKTPTNYTSITTKYSWPGGHRGIDFDNVKGTPINAAAEGYVYKAENDTKYGYGLQVVLRHNFNGKTYYTRYAHLNRIDVTVGSYVQQGKQIGIMGTTGNVDTTYGDGSHLHYELMLNGFGDSYLINPAPYTGRWVAYGTTYKYNYLDGTSHIGWKLDRGKWYYFNDSGVMQTRWVKYGNSWYYFDDTGAMQTGWLKYGESWYYLDDTGEMKTGWYKYGNTWYYFDSTGEMQTGLIQIGNDLYYFNDNGDMLYSTTVYVNGKAYVLGPDGKVIK